MAARFALPVGDRAGLQLKTLLDPNSHELNGVDHRDHHHPIGMVMVVDGLLLSIVSYDRYIVRYIYFLF